MVADPPPLKHRSAPRARRAQPLDGACAFEEIFGDRFPDLLSPAMRRRTQLPRCVLSVNGGFAMIGPFEASQLAPVRGSDTRVVASSKAVVRLLATKSLVELDRLPEEK
jgi:hypothetical protein